VAAEPLNLSCWAPFGRPAHNQSILGRYVTFPCRRYSTNSSRRQFSLSEGERAELALSLIESLDGEADTGVDEAWRVEIDRRIGEIDRGDVQLIPGDEVFARLPRKLG
jgi:putative addiction module component (TIGR02574 family)